MDELWVLVEPLIPPGKTRPQGGGISRVDDHAVFTAIMFVLTSGCAWRHLPPSFGVTVPTAHRWFTEWAETGLWRQVHHAVLNELGGRGLIDWSCVVLDGAFPRAKKGGALTGPSPVDHGKARSKIHTLSDRAGLPLTAGVPRPIPTTATRSSHRPTRSRPPLSRGPRRRKPGTPRGQGLRHFALRNWCTAQIVAVSVK